MCGCARCLVTDYVKCRQGLQTHVRENEQSHFGAMESLTVVCLVPEEWESAEATNHCQTFFLHYGDAYEDYHFITDISDLVALGDNILKSGLVCFVLETCVIQGETRAIAELFAHFDRPDEKFNPCYVIFDNDNSVNEALLDSLSGIMHSCEILSAPCTTKLFHLSVQIASHRATTRRYSSSTSVRHSGQEKGSENVLVDRELQEYGVHDKRLHGEEVESDGNSHTSGKIRGCSSLGGKTAVESLKEYQNKEVNDSLSSVDATVEKDNTKTRLLAIEKDLHDAYWRFMRKKCFPVIPPIDKTCESETRIGHFEIGQFLGEGAFGSVRLGKDTRNGRAVALKFMSKARATKYYHVQSIANEISAVQILAHPHIVRSVEVIHGLAHVYVAFEYVNGPDLNQYVSGHAPLGNDVARDIFHQLASAIEYMHSRSICHRDIKPANVLLNSQTKQIKLIDFGFATKTTPVQYLKDWWGSPGFVAPEILANIPYNGMAADCFSLGMTLERLIVAPTKHTFKLSKELSKDKSAKENVAAILARLTEVFKSEPYSGIPVIVRDVLFGLLETDPRKRITAGEVLQCDWLTDIKACNTTPKRASKTNGDPLSASGRSGGTGRSSGRGSGHKLNRALTRKMSTSSLRKLLDDCGDTRLGNKTPSKSDTTSPSPPVMGYTRTPNAYTGTQRSYTGGNDASKRKKIEKIRKKTSLDSYKGFKKMSDLLSRRKAPQEKVLKINTHRNGGGISPSQSSISPIIMLTPNRGLTSTSITNGLPDIV